MTKIELLGQIRKSLEDIFGNRLKGVILYGSEARDEAAPDSDIDLLVILEGPVNLWDDTKTAVSALYDFQNELMRSIHVVPVDAVEYEAQEFSIYRTAHEQGLRV